MGFEPKNKNIIKALKGDDKQLIEDEKKSGFALPTNTENESELTKAYPFTLQPSVRKKIGDLAEKQGYKSASSFLNDLIKNL